MQTLAENRDFYSRERFFPEDHRSFSTGELSLSLDRFGGIENVTYIYCLKHAGKLFPGRKTIEYFSRSGLNLNRPFLSPAIRCICEFADGTVRSSAPEYPRIFPNGVLSDEYEFVMGKHCFALGVTPSGVGSRRYVTTFCKYHYESQKSLLPNFNQLAHEHVWLPPEYRGEDFNEDWPFAEGELSIQAVVPRYDSAENAIVFCKELFHQNTEYRLYFVVTASEPLTLSENRNDWVAGTDGCESKTYRISFGFGSSVEEALKRARGLLANFEETRAEMVSSLEDSGVPRVSVEHCPEARCFASVFPAYQRGLVCAETEKEACIRASYMKYGFFPIWDHIYPVRDFLVSNQHELARKCLAYMVDYPHWDTNPFVLMHLVIALDEYLAFTQDVSLLKAFYPNFKKSFAFAETLVNQETGLLRYGIDTAVDVMAELGLPRLFYASCVNGWWYDACVCLVNFAKEMDDAELEAKAAHYEALVSAHYEDVFFDKQAHFLRAAVADDGRNMTHEVFLHTKSLPLDYANGAWLFRHIVPPMADFVMKRLYHPWGVTAVPYDCEAPCVYLKGTRMNQHLGHSCKLMRQANCVEGVEHLLNGYLYVFHQTQCAVETFNYSFVAGDQLQRADWQAFSATAAMQAILQGALGLFWHRGGLAYMPAAEDGENHLENFRFGGKTWSFACHGAGNWVSEYRVNGRLLEGSMQIPADFTPETAVCVEITRGERQDCRPVLLWAIGAAVREVKSNPESLAFTIANDCRAQFAFDCVKPAVLTVNGTAVKAEYAPERQRLWFAGDVKKGDVIRIN